MNRSSTGKRQSSRVRTVAGLFFVAFVVTFCVSPTGYLAVRLACNRDGGYTFNSTTYVDGYAVQQAYSPLCLTCFIDVRDGRFKFVDHFVTNSGYSASDQFVNQRYSISGVSDPACSKLRENPRAQSFLRDSALAGDSCIAVNAIDEPATHVYLRRNRSLRSALGAGYGVNEHLIVNRHTGDELAAFRNYSHLPFLFREVMSGAVPLYTCEQEDPRFSSTEFKVIVLHDKSQMTNN